MQHIEFTQQAPDGIQFYFQSWQPETPLKAVICLVHGLGELGGEVLLVGVDPVNPDDLAPRGR